MIVFTFQHYNEQASKNFNSPDLSAETFAVLWRSNLFDLVSSAYTRLTI